MPKGQRDPKFYKGEDRFLNVPLKVQPEAGYVVLACSKSKEYPTRTQRPEELSKVLDYLYQMCTTLSDKPERYTHVSLHFHSAEDILKLVRMIRDSSQTATEVKRKVQLGITNWLDENLI